MRDIPVFTTQNGAASLVLKEIPYRGDAYIRIQDTKSPQALLDECVDFCRCAGAKNIFATGHDYLARYPLHTAIWNMSRGRAGLGETDAVLLPVMQETLEQFRGIYNTHMQEIANASFMTNKDAQKILLKESGFFVSRQEKMLGIGVVDTDCVEAIVAAFAGAGRDVLLALARALTGEYVNVEVASQNVRAVRFYEKLGFTKTHEIAQWYKIF